MFGKLMEQFPEMEKKIFGFVDKIIEIKDLFKAFASGDQFTIDSILEQWGLLGAIIGFVYDSLMSLKKFLDENDVFNKIKTFVEDNDVIDKGVGAAKAVTKMMVNPIGSSVDLYKGLFDKFKEITGIGGGTTVTQNVYGSSDPVATGNTAVRALQGELNSASAQRGSSE